MLKTENVPIASLELDPQNARKHSAKNLKAIMGSLENFGQQKPIVVSKDGVVVAGNGTLVAAGKLGWTHIDIVRSKLEGTALRAYAAVDNRTSDTSEWNMDILPELLEAIGKEFELEEIGFPDLDIKELKKDKREKEKTSTKIIHCPACGHEFE